MQLTRLRIAQPAGAPVICLAVPVSGCACIWLCLYLAMLANVFLVYRWVQSPNTVEGNSLPG